MIKNEIDFIKNEFKNFIFSIKRVFRFKNKYKKYTTKKILVAGGYGYGNTGDEAQCAATLKLLSERYNDYQIVNLTPNIEYSKKQHPNYIHEYASRVLFFNQMRECNCFDFDNSFLMKIVFLLKSILIILNSFLVRAELPTFFINSEITKFLYELKECSLFYFCGGGYLTGSTLSRLWDGIVICKVCEILRTPVVMSGQTIGVWKNKFNKKFAKWGFKKVKIITVRDEDFSLKDLKQIGLFGDNYFATHDDALFCEKSIEEQVIDTNYITVNFHYWGMNNAEKEVYIDKLHKIISFITENTNFNIIFIPMVVTDKCSFDDYIKKYPNDRFKCFDYDYDFRKIRRVIADSKICITMKHHPIIFAMGEDVPVISLVFSQYYMHKNLGAQKQYKQEKYMLNLEDNNFLFSFKQLFDEINENHTEIVSVIKSAKEELKQRKTKFLGLVDKILKESY